jgi:hypothetical protein
MPTSDIPPEIIGADRRRIEELVASGAASLQAAVNTWYHSRGRKSPRELPPPSDQDELDRRAP